MVEKDMMKTQPESTRLPQDEEVEDEVVVEDEEVEDEEGDMLHPVEMVEKTETKSVILEDMEPSDLMEDSSGIRTNMIPDMQDILVPIRVD
jgi:hypothetical protein